MILLHKLNQKLIKTPDVTASVSIVSTECIRVSLYSYTYLLTYSMVQSPS